MSTDEPTGGLDDLWSWAQEPDAQAGPDVDASEVTAVMVVHNAGDWLPRQLLSLARLQPRPGRIVAVDTGGTSDNLELLASARAEGVLDEVVTGGAGIGFGEAVALGLGEQEPEWIWLLHDDSAPEPNALGALLEGIAATDPGILVPKLLQTRRRNYPDAIAEVGQSIARSGRRVALVDEGDIDQGQNFPEPVLGGSTAGMLVRGDVWRRLGGLAPELALHRDGVDLGWRAAEAGYLVSTWPDAALVHRNSGRVGERQYSATHTAHEADRLAALRLVAARGTKPASTVRLSVASTLRALGFLLLKSPQSASAEIRALRRFVSTPRVTASLRARSVDDPADVSGLLPARHHGVKHAFDRIGHGLTERYRDLTSGEGGAADIDELTGDDFAGGLQQRRRVSPLLLLLVLLVGAAVVAGRTLLGSGAVAGGGMLPAPTSLAGAWDAFLRPVPGVGGGNAPWLGFNAFFSTFFFGSPAWFSLAALVLVPVLAAFAAHRLVRQLGGGRAPSALVGSLWAGAVITLGLVTAGDMSGMVLAVVGPMLARSAHRAWTSGAVGMERLRAPAGVAFWLLAAAVAWPIALLLGTVVAAVVLVIDHRRWLEALVAVGLPWLFLTPWLPTLIRWPGRALTGADPLAWPAYPPASTATLVGRILPSGLPLWLNIAFFAVIGLAALVGLALLESTRTRLVVAAGVAVPLACGVVLSRLSLPVNGGQSRALLSAWALLVVAGLLVAICLPHVQATAEGITGWRRVGAFLLAATGVLAAGTWAWVGFNGPVGQSPSELPGYVRDVVASSRDTRVLMIEKLSDEELAWNLVDSLQPRWGSGERSPAGAFATDFAALVQSLSGGDAPEGLADRLAALGVGHVWMKGFGPDRMAAIGNAAGLTRSQASDDVVLWTVLGQPSRAQLVTGGQTIPLSDGVVPEVRGNSWVLLAEEADPRWWATIDGEPLELDVQRPPVSFTVPDGAAGALDYGLDTARGAVVWQVTILLVIAILAAPTLSTGTTARRGMS